MSCFLVFHLFQNSLCSLLCNALMAVTEKNISISHLFHFHTVAEDENRHSVIIHFHNLLENQFCTDITISGKEGFNV